MWGRILGLLLALGVGLFALPAGAVLVQIDFTISLNSDLPANFNGLQLTGTASFGEVKVGDIPALCTPATCFGAPGPTTLDIGSLMPGGHFHDVFYPGDPCFGLATCTLGFGFAGLTGSFDTFAFLNTTTPPTTVPPTPILPIGTLIPSDPCRANTYPGDSCRGFGNIVAYDAPVTIGSFDVRLSVVPEPSSALLFAAACAALPLLRRRRR